ncbi:porin family protein [Aquimarina spongiae]|nr:porin family protein [Aquimarina spongiae]
MKKKIFLLFLIINSFGVISQDYDYLFSSSRVGTKAGVNFTNIVSSSEEFDNTRSRTGYYIGLVFEGMINEKFGINVEAIYARQGFELKENAANHKSTIKIDYIQVPILTKAYLSKSFNVQIGLQMGFKIGDKINKEFFPDLNMRPINNFDLQLVSGLEYLLKTGFFIQARYSYGLSEIIESSGAHSSIFSTGIGFMF